MLLVHKWWKWIERGWQGSGFSEIEDLARAGSNNFHILWVGFSTNSVVNKGNNYFSHDLPITYLKSNHISTGYAAYLKLWQSLSFSEDILIIKVFLNQKVKWGLTNRWILQKGGVTV